LKQVIILTFLIMSLLAIAVARGGGAEPIGVQLNFRNHRKWQPFVNATGGFLYFTEQVPVTGSSRSASTAESKSSRAGIRLCSATAITTSPMDTRRPTIPASTRR